MKTVKIKKIEINGIRGVRSNLPLQLDERSIIIYGDNGSGKSSISDSLEWFLKDEVRHLSSSEIDLKEALKNSHVDVNTDSYIDVSFSQSNIDCQKSLVFKKGKLEPKNSNITDEYREYLTITSGENLILRYQFLTEFIDKTKGDKLKSLSDVIGFSEVNKTKEVLRKAFSSVKSDIKNQNFENQINTQKEVLKEKIGAIVSVEGDFLKKVNEIVKPLNLNISVDSIKDIDQVLVKLKTPLNTPLLNESKFLETTINGLNNLKNETTLINSEYEKYFAEFKSISEDAQSILQIFLSELLKAGHVVLERKYHDENTCPLCLQSKSKEDLLSEIRARLKEIEASAKKKVPFDNAKQSVIKISEERIKRIGFLINDPLLADPLNLSIKNGLTLLNEKLKTYLNSGNEKVMSNKGIAEPTSVNLADSDFLFLGEIESRILINKKALEKDNTTTTYSNLSAAKDAFLRIKKFELEREKLEKQKNSLGYIYNEFVRQQKEALENFINTFSVTINEYYQFMNPGEQFDEIRIVTMGEEDELVGITIQYKYNGEWISPPQKYFSESHLNCYGISFFLASVQAFNHKNKFIVLDDVISSFDANHRKRFADLLLDKFSDYQIILLTHEINWFEYVRNTVKNKNWLVNTVKWSDAKGTHFDDSPGSLREKIVSKISNNNMDKLGNDIREYLESILKEIAQNLEVKVKFQFNEKNEDRMAYELLSELKGRISKSVALSTQNNLLERTLASTFIGNKDSHNSSYITSIGDFKAFWKDVQDIEDVFFCSSCNTSVQFKYYDEATKMIRCKCTAKTYDLKK